MEEFIGWIIIFDKFFDYTEMREDKKVKLVACKLKGDAFTWWDHVQNEKRLMGKSSIISWERMKELMV